MLPGSFRCYQSRWSLVKHKDVHCLLNQMFTLVISLTLRAGQRYALAFDWLCHLTMFKAPWTGSELWEGGTEFSGGAVLFECLCVRAFLPSLLFTFTPLTNTFMGKCHNIGCFLNSFPWLPVVHLILPSFFLFFTFFFYSLQLHSYSVFLDSQSALHIFGGEGGLLNHH